MGDCVGFLVGFGVDTGGGINLDVVGAGVGRIVGFLVGPKVGLGVITGEAVGDAGSNVGASVVGTGAVGEAVGCLIEGATVYVGGRGIMVIEDSVDPLFSLLSRRRDE